MNASIPKTVPITSGSREFARVASRPAHGPATSITSVLGSISRPAPVTEALKP